MNQGWKTRVATLAVLSLVFGVGVLSGLAVDRFLGSDAAPRAEARVVEEPVQGQARDTRAQGSESRESSSTESGSDGSRSRWLIHRVDLSDAQRMTVDSVLAFYRTEVRHLTDDYNDAYWSAVQSTRDELRQILSPEQRARYDSLLVENDRRRGRDGND